MTKSPVLSQLEDLNLSPSPTSGNTYRTTNSLIPDDPLLSVSNIKISSFNFMAKETWD